MLVTAVFSCIVAACISIPASAVPTRRSVALFPTGTEWSNLAWGNTGDSLPVASARSTSTRPRVVFVDMDKGSGQIKSLKAAGSTVVCYMSAGTVESWRSDASAFRPYVSSKSNYANEHWLDITQWRSFSGQMAKRIDRAASLGCDGLEADNMDCYLHNCVPAASSSTLKQKEAEYARWLASAAHSRGLAVGLKNALQILKGLESSFDFAINESCTRFNECNYYTKFKSSNKAVFGMEYSAGAKACSQAKTYGISMKYKSGGSWKDC